MIKNENDSGEIKLKTKSDLDKKTFFDNKENAYRVKKLIKLMEILKKPDFDIDLDEMKFTKIPKYKNYSLVKLTKPELSKILRNYDLREETYLNFLGIQKIDKDTYSLQLDIFIDKFIRINLKEITFEENVEAIFTMFDKDKNERITKEEVTDLLNFFQETNQLGFDQKTLANVSEAIFRQMADSGQSYISKNSLAKYLNKYAEEDITINPFTKVKTSDAVTKLKRNNTTKITSEEEKVLERINRKKDRSKINKFWVLNKKMIIWTIIYSILCVVIGFINRSLEGGRQYATTKAARFFAGIIFFNMAILVLYMCNFILTFLSSTRLKFYLPLNDTKLYHAVCASVLGVAVIPHVLIHIFGDYREIAALTAKKPKDAYVTVAWLTFANLTGATGVICLIIFSMLIILPHIKPLINKKYEVFLHSHKLFYLALVMLLLHANTPDTKRWPFLAFMALPILLFIVELCVRFYRYCKLRPKILRIKYLRSGVIFLELEKPFKFEYKCGQYAQINIPKISKWQYHPFTFASSPCDDTLFFYINPVGDWTKDLKSLGNADKGK
jgi:Ca2+-binding EF-hand superfamily protein